MRKCVFLAAFAIGAVGAMGPALAAPDATLDLSAANSQAVLAVLGAFLVIAVALESAMATIFNWRFFRERFDGKGVKTPIMILVGWLIANQLDLDIFRELVQALGQTNADPGLISEILTALLLAGGSSGFNQVFKKLGVRAPTLANTGIQAGETSDTAEASQTVKSAPAKTAPARTGGDA